MIDFYGNDLRNVNGFFEGRRYLGQIQVTTDSNGDVSFDIELEAKTSVENWITTTATAENTGSTSEFSAAIRANGQSNQLVVTNSNDAGPGSLRQAILSANNAEGIDPLTIIFSIPETDTGYVDVDAGLDGGDPDPDVFVISPTSTLPPLTRGNVTIDGRSQQIATSNTNPFGPEIVLSGNLAGEGVDGLTLALDNNAVHGLNIQFFGGSGILIDGDSAPPNRFIGGGAGPSQTASIGPGHLLNIGDARLDVIAYEWDVVSNYRFGESGSTAVDAQAGGFAMTIPLSQAGGLFVDLASGRSLGDITLTSTWDDGTLLQSWRLENARVSGYESLNAEFVEVTFSFDNIETTINDVGIPGQVIDTQTSRWEVGPGATTTSGGGAGPDESNSTGAGDLLYIDGRVIDVLGIGWGTSPYPPGHRRNADFAGPF